MSLTPRIDALSGLAVSNLIINGNMDWSQRGAGPFGSGAIGADQWRSVANGGMSLNTQRSSDVPTQAQSGFQSSFSNILTCTAGAAVSTGNSGFRYAMEGANYARIHSAPARLQFWVKASGTSVTGTYSVAFRNASTNRSYVAQYTIAAAGVWQKVTIDLTMDTTGTWAFDNTNGLFIDFPCAVGSTSTTSTLGAWQAGNFLGASGQADLTATTNNTFQIAQVMLIPASLTSGGVSLVDVPFQRAGKDIQQELAMCQRYFYTAAPIGDSQVASPVAYGNAIGTTQATAVMFFPVTMRAIPALSTTGSLRLTDDSAQITITSIALLDATNRVSRQSATVSFSVAAGLTAFRPYRVEKNTDASATVAFSAEL